MPGRSFGRIRLGQRLQELRERAGVSREAALAEIEKPEHHPDTLRKVEDGDRPIELLEVRTLARMYGCSDEEVAELRRLWHEASKPSAFASFGLPENVVTFLEMERAAVEIWTWQSLIIPGMLQIEAYSRRLFELAGVDSNQIEPRVDARLKRQERLRPSETAPDPLRLTAVIGEEALRHCLQEPEVGLAQFDRLIEAAGEDNVELRIMDLDRGLHSGMSGEFTYLRLPEPVADLVYEETASGGRLTDNRPVVERLQRRFGELREQALAADESLKRLARLADQHRKGRRDNR